MNIRTLILIVFPPHTTTNACLKLMHHKNCSEIPLQLIGFTTQDMYLQQCMYVCVPVKKFETLARIDMIQVWLDTVLTKLGNTW